ncbi:dual specificity protein phosphatase CDC-14 alpha, putative [Bradyrhizobium oligotrophicum S58]|uniref:Dual specificity protein phosphatase CDC-14 alpha, putative n=1 Tax=Bradyrhizobium oligotrophicum S58 TaxID=1245469 RepID=M4ZC49_9BRAD|nr:dual specificity protein phosphatase CDC-14 alpha, putative [Bradyrhizobium oligotrophicum S58]
MPQAAMAVCIIRVEEAPIILVIVHLRVGSLIVATARAADRDCSYARDAKHLGPQDGRMVPARLAVAVSEDDAKGGSRRAHPGQEATDLLLQARSIR